MNWQGIAREALIAAAAAVLAAVVLNWLRKGR